MLCLIISEHEPELILKALFGINCLLCLLHLLDTSAPLVLPAPSTGYLSTTCLACTIYWIPQHHLSCLHHLLDTSAPLVLPAPSAGYLSTTCLACTICWIPQHHSWVAKHVQTFSQTYTYTKRLHVKTYADVPFLLTLHMDTALIIHVHLLINQINTKLISILLPGENGCCKSKTSKENTKYNILHIQTADSEQTTLIIMTAKKEKKREAAMYNVLSDFAAYCLACWGRACRGEILTRTDQLKMTSPGPTRWLGHTWTTTPQASKVLGC